MSLDLQQKNIINPFTEDLIGEPFFQIKRNRFVQDVLHEAHTNLLLTIPVGQKLDISPQEISSLLGDGYPHREITIAKEDLVVYTALYPQNCTVVEDSEGTIRLEPLGRADSVSRLKELVTRLDTAGMLDLYSTNSSPASINNGVITTGPDTAHLRLIAISPNHSNEYLQLIRKSVGSTDTVNSTIAEEVVMSSIVNSYISSDNNVDIYDWRKNCNPDTDTDKVYYNPIDEKFYFTKRTMSSERGQYDIHINNLLARDVDEDAPPHPGPQPTLQRNTNNLNQAMADYQREMAAWMLIDAEYRMYQAQRTLEPTPIRAAIKNGITEILKLSGRFSQNNLNNLLEGADTPNKKYEFVSHIDLRPGSRWIYVVKVSKRHIDLLEEENNLAVSYDEFELTPLQKAKLLLDRKVNKTTLRKVFEAEDLIRFLPPVSRLLKDYSEIISDEDIPAKVLSGIRMGSESIKISSFIDYLSICFIYNKRMLDDRNVIEFSFSEKFSLEYLTVDGYLFSRGIGNKKFYSLPESEEEVPAKILNAFSQATPTTFSIIARSAEIFNETRVREQSDRKSWISFMIENLYPKIDDSAISIRKAAAKSDAAKRRARRGKLFTKISSLKKEGDDIRNELERASKKDVDNNGRAMYRVGSMLSGLDCNTAQAAALNNALKLWQAFSGKTRWRSVVRLTILALRDEIIKDSVLKAYASKAIQADDNPDLIIREIERSINNQIFCGLDVLGNVIETSFLDPKDMNPSKKAGKSVTLGESLKIELKLPRGMGSMGKKSDVYEKMIKEILTGFIKSLVAGIVKDILEAALGCAPNGNNSEALRATIKDMNFGYVDINSYLDDVDITAIAIESGISQVTRQMVDGEEVVAYTPPNNDQIKKLLTDISYMSTPGELDALLLGDGEILLYSLLVETLSDGTITYPFTRVKESGGRERTLNRTIDPSVYRNLELTQESLQEFLLALGDAMNEENAGRIAQFTFNPMEAYCNTKDPMGLEDFGLGISMEQLDAQYTQVAQDKINKINAMCDWLKELEEIKRKLQELIDNLPIMDYYEDMLKLIANISNGIMEGLASLWASLWGEEAEDVTDPIFNLYVTRFGQDLFNTLHLMLDKRMVAQISRFDGHDGTPQPHASEEVEQDIEDLYSEILNELNNIRPEPTQDFELLVQNLTNDNRISVDGFYYSAPSNRRINPDRHLPLPYMLPNTTDPWYWFESEISASRSEKRAQYAFTAGPKDIREKLRKVPRDTEDLEEYFENLKNKYSSVIREKAEVTGLSPTLQNYASQATCQLHLENLSSGSISITTEILLPTGEKKLVPLASYNPLETDREFGENSVNYYSLLSSIGPSNRGGPISPETLLRRSNTSFGQMPPRNDLATANLINRLFVGELLEGSNSKSVGNYGERIENHLDISYAQDLGKSRLIPFIKAINKNPFEINKDKCVNQEEVYLASALAMVIQSRLQSFFMNTLPLTRVYPQWGGLGTTKLVTNYLQNKIISELEDQGIINQIYNNLDAYQKVYIDNPDNIAFRQVQSPDQLSIDLNAQPRQIVASIIEKTYLAVLNNISKAKSFEQIIKSPYAEGITNKRYKSTLSRLFGHMKNEILNAGEGEEPLGLSEYNFNSGHPSISLPGPKPDISDYTNLDRDNFGLITFDSLESRSELLSDLSLWFIKFREYERFRAANPNFQPNRAPQPPGPRPIEPAHVWPESRADFELRLQQYRSDLATWEESSRAFEEWVQNNQNGLPRYPNEALRMIENNLLDENNEITDLGMVYGAYYLPISLLYALYIISYDHLVDITTNFRSGHMRSLIEKYGADDTFLSAIKGMTVNQFSKNIEGMPVSIETKRIDPSVMEEYRRLKAERQRRIQTLRLNLTTILQSEQLVNLVMDSIVEKSGSKATLENYLFWSLPLLLFLPVWALILLFINDLGDEISQGDLQYNSWTTTYYDRKDIRKRIDTLATETATAGKINEFLVLLKNNIGIQIKQNREEESQQPGLRGDRRLDEHVGDEIAYDFLNSIINGESHIITLVYPSVETFVSATPDDPLETSLLITGYEDFLSAEQYFTMANPNNLTRATREYRSLSQVEKVAHLLSLSLSKRLEEIMLDRESKLAEKIELEDLLTV